MPTPAGERHHGTRRKPAKMYRAVPWYNCTRENSPSILSPFLGMPHRVATLLCMSSWATAALLSQGIAPSGQVSSGQVSTLCRSLFNGAVDPEAVAAACSDQVVWDDMAAPAEATGRAAVRELLAAKYPAGSAIVLERVSDGAQSGGLTFHRAAAQSMDGPIGLRGTMFFELDASGQIEYVREGAEPIWKAGTLIETLLNTVTQLVPRPPKEPPSYTPSSPTGASAIVRCACDAWRGEPACA